MVEHIVVRRDRKQSRRAILIWLLILGALLFVLFYCEPRNRTRLDGGGEAALNESTFGIGGDTTQAMSPGVTVSIDVMMTNPNDRAMAVSGLVITVDRVAAPRADRLHPCSVDDFTVEQPEVDLRATVPANTFRSLSSLGVDPERWPRVGMVNRSVNQDGCKGASVTLAYSGSGTLQN
jgi:hypothetical protein